MTNSLKIFGVRVDKVTLDEAVARILVWTKGGAKHYVVTPNVEFLMAARQDSEFGQVLADADLAIPDSARFGWAGAMVKEKNPLWRRLLWPTFFLKDCPLREPFPVTTGVDLMQELCRQSVKEGVVIGLLGGRNGVALKLKERLKETYPEIKVVFAESGGVIDQTGKIVSNSDKTQNHPTVSPHSGRKLQIPPVDILFVAFGHIKQEKWIARHIDRVPAKVFIGVGGAFDYLSGTLPRAPKWLQDLGLEWLFRLITQPWRIKRFGALLKFVFLV